MESGLAGVGVFAAVKVPVNDIDRAYATGEWDAGGGVTFGGPLGRSYGWAEVAWWVLGDPPDGELRDPWVVRLELGRPLGRRWWAAIAAEGAGETVPGTGSVVGVEAIARRRVGRTAAVGGVLFIGLTDAAPDAYLALEWRLGR